MAPKYPFLLVLTPVDNPLQLSVAGVDMLLAYRRIWQKKKKKVMECHFCDYVR